MLATEDLSGYETLPLARVKRASADGATPELDEDYIPPSLALDAWPSLQKYVRDISDRVGQNIEVLSQRAGERKWTFESQQPGALEGLMRLTALNEAYAVLNSLAFVPGVHPFVAYHELCRFVGQLSIHEEDRRVAADIPRYDHDDLARIFKWIKLRVDQLLRGSVARAYEQRPFIGDLRPRV